MAKKSCSDQARSKQKGKTNNPAGRPKGIIDKRNLRVLDLVNEYDADPALFLVHVMKGNADALATKRKFEEDDTTEPDKDGMVKIKPIIKFEDRAQAAKELLPYLYGKRKPIDSDGNDATDLFALLLNASDANN
jgi:hypothetical protein